jgi:hypothetical protein
VVEPPLHPMSSLNPTLPALEKKKMDVMELFTALCEPFPIEEISWRVGPTNERRVKPGEKVRGQPLCYVNARTVMDRLDSVCGFDGWQCSYSAGGGASIVCNIGIRVAGEWVWKADGAGASDTEPEKGMLSDAFKRAAVRWGVGRYLYEIDAPWIDLDERKNIRKEDHQKLRALHDEYARKAGWGDESGSIAYRLLLADLKVMPPEARAAFVNANMSLIDRMPVVMRRYLLQQAKKEAA